MCIFIINMPRKITIHLQTTGTRIYHADDFFILPQIADEHGFFYENIKNTVYIFRAYGLLKIQTKP